MKIAVVSGGFDPIHSGHIKYMESARKLADSLVVGLNSDSWLIRKKGRFFLPFSERKVIVESIKFVSEAMDFNDDDDSAANLIEKVVKIYGPGNEILFCNGGDRKNDTPQSSKEHAVAQKHYNVFFVYGVGGTDKKNSSSWILNRWLNE
jgi:cytidyltransferase-like protein